VGAVVLAALAVAGCGGGMEDNGSRDAQVYEATIRDVLAKQPTTDPKAPLPIVYVVGVGEERIAASVQAAVTQALDEDADIRFADKREEAVLGDEDDAPVRDEGLLVAVGEVAPDRDPVDVQVEVYRSELDWSKRVLTIARGSSQWTVTSESSVPADGS
jgi:hypothetical protein